MEILDGVAAMKANGAFDYEGDDDIGLGDGEKGAVAAGGVAGAE